MTYERTSAGSCRPCGRDGQPACSAPGTGTGTGTGTKGAGASGAGASGAGGAGTSLPARFRRRYTVRRAFRLRGYTRATFGAEAQAAFVKALAVVLKVLESDIFLTIEDIDGDGGDTAAAAAAAA